MRKVDHIEIKFQHPLVREIDSESFSLSAVNLGGDTTLDFVIPKLPARAIIFGKITDGSGNGIPNVLISAYSRSITDAANMAFSGTTQTDIYGNYSLVVLSGTGYQLSFVPPTPKP